MCVVCTVLAGGERPSCDYVNCILLPLGLFDFVYSHKMPMIFVPLVKSP